MPDKFPDIFVADTEVPPDIVPEKLIPPKLNKLVLGLYVKFVSTFILSLPDEESRNARKCDELSFTAVIPTSEAAPAVSEPALTHLVSVPSEDKT